MVQRVDEWQCRGTIKSSSVIQGGGDGHRCLVDIGYTKIDFPHFGPPTRIVYVIFLGDSRNERVSYLLVRRIVQIRNPNP